MQTIRIWAAAVCAAAIAASVAQLAAPEGTIQKALRCVIGLFFVCCVVSPFAKGLAAWPDSAEISVDLSPQLSSEQLTQEIDRQTAQAFAENVRSIVAYLLEEQEIFPKEIQVMVHVGEDSNIYISSLSIRLGEEFGDATETVSRIVQDGTGITPEIQVEGGDVA